jgi:hypothetical protein
MAGFDAIFAVLERGRRSLGGRIAVLPSASAAFERGISSLCDARLSLDEGIAASCQGFAAKYLRMQGAPCAPSLALQVSFAGQDPSRAFRGEL